MGFFRRLFGICVTPTPGDQDCWSVEGNRVVIQRNRAPELSQAGGAIRLEGKGLTNRLLVLHGVDGKLHAYSNRCTCAGWRIDPVAGEEKVRCCTMGASTFDYSGKRLSGSGKTDLQAYPVETGTDTLVVNLG
jgi:nitrite reductase/ring-hydroxylating ferredoxin subunit